MTVDDIVEITIGRFGKYQFFILFLLSLGRFPVEFQMTNVVFLLPSVNYVCRDEDARNMTNHCPCQNPEYDQSMIVSSVTSEWNLICGRIYLASLTQSVLQIGILIGSLFYGYISDRYGRKKAVLLAQFLTAVFVVLSAVAPHLWMFILCRFLIGTATGGMMLCCYILLVELSGKSFRPYLCGLQELSYILGYILLPTIAYFVREWRYLQLATSVPWLLTILYFWIIPESPRWYITAGKEKEAIEILKYIAKKNNRPTEDITAMVTQAMEETQNIKCEHKRGSYLDLFRTPKIRLYTIINALIWMCCSHTYFGVNQYIGRLPGNIYVNISISGVSQVPALALLVLGVVYLERKLCVTIAFCVLAISLLVFIFIPKDLLALNLVFAVIGVIGCFASFALLYLYSSEVFPTVVRNSALGFASVSARLGGFVAPFVVNIGVEWISILIFSTVSFCAALLCSFLPETKDIVLLDSIEQTEQNKNKKVNSEVTNQHKLEYDTSHI